MAVWRCFSQHGMEFVESDQSPSNSARQCVLEEGDPGDYYAEIKPGDTKLRIPPIASEVLGPAPEHSTPVAFRPVFRISEPTGPATEDPFMPEVVNPPSSPTTNLLRGPWNGTLTVDAHSGINPKFSFANPDDESQTTGDNWFKQNSTWIWLVVAGIAFYLWNKHR